MICLALLVAGLFASCTTQVPPPVAQACAAGYSAGAPVVQLAVSDNGHPITAHLSDSISIVLTAPGFWGGVNTSDDSVLVMVPLKLTKPPDSGTAAVCLAKHTGTAVLTSFGPAIACPPPVNQSSGYCGASHWKVTVTVVT